MQRIIMVSMLLVLSLISLVPRGVALAWQGPANLLHNPGFEGDYHSWSGIPEVYVAQTVFDFCKGSHVAQVFSEQYMQVAYFNTKGSAVFFILEENKLQTFLFSDYKGAFCFSF